jgi:two-component system, OmpR family, sensor histidine kinase KdpD
MHYPYSTRDRVLFWVMPWLVPLLATLIAWALSPILPKAHYSMIYLAGVLFTAVFTRVKPALACAVLSFLAFNFFHFEPHFTFYMVHQQDILTVALFVLVAVVTGHLAARLREQVVALEDSDRWNKQQMLLAEELSSCVNGESVIMTLDRHLQTSFEISSVVLYRENSTDDFRLLSGELLPIPLNESLPQSNDSVAEVLLDINNNSVMIAFCTRRTCQGQILIKISSALDEGQKYQLEGFTGLARLAWSRVVLNEVLRSETMVKEREQLRSALLSSISHDLRTPLATMIGSVSTLIELHDALDRSQRDELLQNTLSEAQRLNRYIQKLLDMTRLGHGELSLDRDWVGIDDILSVVIKRSKSLLNGSSIKVDLQSDLPLLHVHPALIEQAVFNVLENAMRYAPKDTSISIKAYATDDQLQIDIHNYGPVIPEESWNSIFDMFFTFAHGDQDSSGTGLGLAICQGILGAHGGLASVIQSSSEAGTTLRISLPLKEAQQSAQEINDDTHTDN